MGIGVTVARLTLNQLVKVRILDPQLKDPRVAIHPGVLRSSSTQAEGNQFAMAALFFFMASMEASICLIMSANPPRLKSTII